jgi:hypothetical protein
VVYRPPWPAATQALSVSEEPIHLQAEAGDPALALYVEQQYQLVEAAGGRGPWKVATRAYRYRIDRPGGQELLLWHWHPGSAYHRPHLHGQADGLAGLHLPTGRVSVEAIIRLLVEELGARPRRADWRAVLDDTEEAFRGWRTWS